MNRRCISSCTRGCSVAVLFFLKRNRPEEEPSGSSFCSAGIASWILLWSPLDSNWLLLKYFERLLDLQKNLWQRWWIWDTCWMFSRCWIDWIVGVSISGIRGRFFRSPAGRSQGFFFPSFWLARHQSALNSLNLQRTSLRPHPRRPFWGVSHHWANMYKTDLTGGTLYN